MRPNPQLLKKSLMENFTFCAVGERSLKITGAFSLGSLVNTIFSFKLGLVIFFINLQMSSKGEMCKPTGEGLARQRKESAIPSGNTSSYV